MLTLSDVLAMPAVRGADPVVLAGAERLAREVRWVHTTELADIGPLLRGGDLVLTTGIALPGHPAALAAFAQSLADSRAAGLLLELGRRWQAAPDTLVAECERLGLPLVALRREVRFAAITQAVGERLVDAQVEELREAQRVHDTFTDLSISEAGPDEVLAAVQRLSGAPVVMENGQHRVLDYRSGPGDMTAFLEDWERRSRSAHGTERTFWDPSNGWLVTRVGRRERDWGRLVVGAPTAPSQRLVAVVERGAAALALHRLHDRHRDTRTRRLHQELLLGLLADAGDPELLRRATLAGLPAGASRLVGLALRPEVSAGDPAPGSTASPAGSTAGSTAGSASGSPAGSTAGSTAGGPAAQLDEVVAACLRAVEVVAAPALVAAFEGDVRLLLAVPSRADAERLVDRLVADVRTRVAVVAAAGTTVGALEDSGRTLREARQVLAAVPSGRAALPGSPSVHRLEDVHVRGLLTLLADDERVQAFTARELGPLLAADARDGSQLTRTARVLVELWGSKSAAAARLAISRPVLYDRIGRIERVIGASLDDAEVRTSLHLALLGADLAGPARDR